MFLGLLKKPQDKQEEAKLKKLETVSSQKSTISTQSYAKDLKEGVRVILPDSNSFNENILTREKAPFLQKIRSGHKKQAHEHQGDEISDFWSQSVSYFDHAKQKSKNVQSNRSKSKKSSFDPVAKFLGGGFKQIRKSKVKGGMTIINFRTDIDHPDPERLEAFLQTYKLKNRNQKEVKFMEAICNIPNGSIWFCKKEQRTLFDSTGPGIPLYFIFLKTLIVFFFIASLLSCFLIFKNMKAFSHSHDQDISSENTGLVETFQSSLVSSTLAAAMRFALSVNDISLDFDKPETISVRCKGLINLDLNYTQFGLIDSHRSAQVSQTYYNIDCTNFEGLLYSLQDCDGKSECEVIPKRYWIKESCLNDLSTYQKSFSGLLKVQCKEATIGADHSIRTFYSSYFIVCITIIFIFIFVLIWLYCNEIRFMQQYKKKYRNPSEYTIELRGLPPDYNKQMVIDGVYNMIGRFSRKAGYAANPVIDLQVAHTKKMLILEKQTEDLQQKIQLLMIKIEKKLNMNLPTGHMNVDELITKLKTSILFADTYAKKKIKDQFGLLNKIKDMDEELKTLKSKKFKVIHDAKNIKSIFVTFQRIKDRKFFMEVFKYKLILKFPCCRFSKTDKRALNGRILFAEEPPQPININWENYSYTTKQKFLRRALSWSFYILMYCMPLLALLLFSRMKSEINSSQPACGSFNYDQVDKDFFEENFAKINENFLSCLCLLRPSVLSSEILHTYNHNSSFCDSINKNDDAFLKVSIIESIVISVISVVFDFVYRYLVIFEKYNDSNDTKMSLIKKLFFWKYFTTGIIPLVSGLYFPYFGGFGFYDEITPYWYKNKGVSIIISSMLRIPILALVGFLRWLIPTLLVKYDQKWTGDRKLTRKVTHKDYQEVYRSEEFDIELSYAEACTTLFIAFTYGFWMPLIFPASFLQLVVLLTRDKILIFNTYMFFTQYTKGFHIYARDLLSVAILPGIFILIWTYGNIETFKPDSIKYIDSYEKITGVVTQDGLLTVKTSAFQIKNINTHQNSFKDAFWHRSIETKFSQFLVLILICYFLNIVVRWANKRLRGKISHQRMNKGIKTFTELEIPKDEAEEDFQFEDLVPANDIIYAKSLYHILQGRGVGSKDVSAMHKNRLSRLIGNLKRTVQKMKAKTKVEKNLDKFTNFTNSIACANPIVKKSSIASMTKPRQRSTIRKISTFQELEKINSIQKKQFLALSSYNHKLHPMFKDFYIRRVLYKVLDEVDKTPRSNVLADVEKKVFANLFKVLVVSPEEEKNFALEEEKMEEQSFETFTTKKVVRNKLSNYFEEENTVKSSGHKKDKSKRDHKNAMSIHHKSDVMKSLDSFDVKMDDSLGNGEVFNINKHSEEKLRKSTTNIQQEDQIDNKLQFITEQNFQVKLETDEINIILKSKDYPDSNPNNKRNNISESNSSEEKDVMDKELTNHIDTPKFKKLNIQKNVISIQNLNNSKYLSSDRLHSFGGSPTKKGDSKVIFVKEMFLDRKLKVGDNEKSPSPESTFFNKGVNLYKKNHNTMLQKEIELIKVPKPNASPDSLDELDMESGLFTTNRTNKSNSMSDRLYTLPTIRSERKQHHVFEKDVQIHEFVNSQIPSHLNEPDTLLTSQRDYEFTEIMLEEISERKTEGNQNKNKSHFQDIEIYQTTRTGGKSLFQTNRSDFKNKSPNNLPIQMTQMKYPNSKFMAQLVVNQN